MKEKITKWYWFGLWTDEKLRDAVVKGIITADDYEEITGEQYA